MKDIFTPYNTRWESEINEYGNREEYLVYRGDMEKLSEETGISEDRLYELLGEYEDESRDLIETRQEIEEARKGQY